MRTEALVVLPLITNSSLADGQKELVEILVSATVSFYGGKTKGSDCRREKTFFAGG